MNASLQRRVQRYGWDKASGLYERYWSRQLGPAQDRLLELAALRPREHVLEVACGTGLVSLRAAQAVGPGGRLVGTDLSERMIHFVRDVASKTKLGQAHFEHMDAEELTLPDATFDAALCALGLMYFPDPRKALQEMHRVLRPGGRAVVAVWGERGRCGWAEIFPIVDARVNTDVCPLFFQLGTGDALRYTLDSAGFVDVELERMTVPLRYPNAADAIGAAFAGGPVALAYSRFDERTKDDAHAEYLTSIEPYRKDGGYVIPGEFVIARGWKA